MGAKAIKDTKILFVDNEPDFREIVASSFESMGYQVIVAASGHEAFELIKANPVDAIISDIRMPNGDGVELLDRVRENMAEMPIILLVTGHSDLSVEEAYNKGAEALFLKPFDLKTLHDAVTRLLIPPQERWSKKSEAVDVEIKVNLHFQGVCEAIDARVLGLGRGGFFVALSQRPNIGDLASFTMTFDSSQSVSGRGVVRWIRFKGNSQYPDGCGIEFTYLGEAERQKVLDMVAAHKPKAFIPSR